MEWHRRLDATCRWDVSPGVLAIWMGRGIAVQMGVERALAIQEARPGPDHPDTARSPELLAAVVAELENR